MFRHRDVHFQSPVVFLPNPEQVVNSRKEESLIGVQAVMENPHAYSDKIMTFNANCVAEPITIAGKVGDSIMFENRSNYQRSITVGDQHFSVMPFGHVTLSFGDIDTYQVNCDSFDNVGLIGIQ
jgi:hypothetical protein